jgi:hypothetical protein
MKLDEARHLLEDMGYMVESEGNDYLKGYLEKYSRWESIKDTPEGDDLWDEICEEYDQDFREMVTDCYDPENDSDILDVSGYLSSADNLYPEFFSALKKMGYAQFKYDVRKAFGNKSSYLYDAVFGHSNVRLRPNLESEPYYLVFEVRE